MENCLEIQFLLDMLQSPSVIDSVLTSVTYQEHQNEQQQQTSGTSFSCISCSGLIDATAMSSRPWSTRLERARLGQLIDVTTFLMERENDLSSDDESSDSSLSLLGDEALRITLLYDAFINSSRVESNAVTFGRRSVIADFDDKYHFASPPTTIERSPERRTNNNKQTTITNEQQPARRDSWNEYQQQRQIADSSTRGRLKK